MNENEVDGLTSDEIAVLKEVAADRMAISRVGGKIKNWALWLTAVIVAYLTLVDNGIAWLRFKLGL